MVSGWATMDLHPCWPSSCTTTHQNWVKLRPGKKKIRELNVSSLVIMPLQAPCLLRQGCLKYTHCWVKLIRQPTGQPMAECKLTNQAGVLGHWRSGFWLANHGPAPLLTFIMHNHPSELGQIETWKEKSQIVKCQFPGDHAPSTTLIA